MGALTAMKPRILIIDENRKNLRFAKVVIERVNRYDVRIESDPRVAVDVAHDFRPDLIVMEFEMSAMGGCDVACAVRAEPAFATVPIVFLTSLLAPTELNDDSVARGGVSVLSKPVNPRNLCDRLDLIMEVTNHSRQLERMKLN